MIYAIVDVHFPRHPRAIQAGPMARDLYICALCYCKEHLNDGRIPKGVVPTLAPGNPWRRSLQRLLDVGLWTEDETCYIVHDYHERNPLAEVERARIEASRKRKRAWKSRRNGRPSTDEPPERLPGDAVDAAVDRLPERSSRARVASPQAVPPYGPPANGQAWTGKPSQDPARLAPCRIAPLWRNPHEYHVHGRECRFP